MLAASFLVISLSIAFFAILSAFALSFYLCLFRNVISKLNPYSFIQFADGRETVRYSGSVKRRSF